MTLPIIHKQHKSEETLKKTPINALPAISTPTKYLTEMYKVSLTAGVDNASLDFLIVLPSLVLV